MKRKRFTEEQIIGVLKEHELGAKTADLCRKHGISEATFYNWKSKFGGMDVSEAKRLRQLEAENGQPGGIRQGTLALKNVPLHGRPAGPATTTDARSGRCPAPPGRRRGRCRAPPPFSWT